MDVSERTVPADSEFEALKLDRYFHDMRMETVTDVAMVISKRQNKNGDGTISSSPLNLQRLMVL